MPERLQAKHFHQKYPVFLSTCVPEVHRNPCVPLSDDCCVVCCDHLSYWCTEMEFMYLDLISGNLLKCLIHSATSLHSLEFSQWFIIPFANTGSNSLSNFYVLFSFYLGLSRAHQGCILSLCFFNFYAEYIIRNAGLEEAQAGIQKTILHST